MRILISNDDGIESPGIQALASSLSKVGEVTVVAPHRERSTAGHSLTLHKALRIHKLAKNQFAVTGTPADCVYMAIHHILKRKPDLIVSGINRGANLGNDVYYSGTVAAAREGAYSGICAVAISLCFKHFRGKHIDFEWNTAAHFARRLALRLKENKFPKNVVHNINVPNLPAKKIKGVQISSQGRRHYDNIITKRLDPRKRPYYWLGGGYKGFEPIKGSDCLAVENGFISVTPLSLDNTDYERLGELVTWDL